MKTFIIPAKFNIVFKNNFNQMIASIGAIGYSDYPTYIRSHGLDYANKRRRLYKIRQNTDRTVMNTNGYGADRLFW